jgi:GT2 family glycosyltransferase
MNCRPIADAIADVLRPRSVLLAGAQAQEVASALRERGIAAAVFEPGQELQCGFELAACVGAGDGATPELLSRAAPAVLVWPAEPAPRCLELFASWGFAPDLRPRDGFPLPGTVLFRKFNDASPELERLEREVRLMYIALERTHSGLDQLARQFRDVSLAVQDLSRGLAAVTDSRIWRVLCWLGGLALAVGAFVSRRRGCAPSSAGETASGAEWDSAGYARWIEEVEAPRLSALPGTAATGPSISIIMPVGRGADSEIDRTIDSVRLQNCGSCELIVVPYGPQAHLRLRASVAVPEGQMQLRRLDQSPSLGSAWNAGLEAASGEYIALVDEGDALSPDALVSISQRVARLPDTDVLYSDEDRIDAAGRRFLPFFKPDWSPDLMYSQNYIGRLVVFRRTLAWGAGGFREDLKAAHDFDLTLRLWERGAHIRRLPRVLYHRYSSPGGLITDPLPEWNALEGHLYRTSPGARIEECGIIGRRRVRYPLPSKPGVSIIIPSGGNVAMLEGSLQELTARTDYPLYEVVVVDNSTGDAIERLVQDWQRVSPSIRSVDWRCKPFNFSAICNAGARTCRSPFLLFLNDDTKVIAPDWLRALVELGARPEVGAVGAKLLFPDGTIQHAGVVLGLFGRSGHAFKGLDGRKRHYFDFPDVVRNVSALTGACLLVCAEVFEEMHGFDEENFPVDSNDIDLCLRIGRAGYRVLYTPHALLSHMEAVSKRQLDRGAHPAEREAFWNRWRDVILSDPFYHPELTRSAEDFSLRRKHEQWLVTRED